MVIVWGSGLYGKVDEIPGLCHVATKFGHLYYIPLIPVDSVVVFEKTADGWRGIEIGVSLKSVLVAWFRAVMSIVAVGLLITTLIMFNDGKTGNAMFYGALTLGGLGLIIGSYYMRGIGTASYDRAMAIAEQAGFPDDLIALIEHYYAAKDRNDDELEAWDESGLPMHQDE